MNWIDRAVGWISPTAGLRRVRARTAMEVLGARVRAYEGAKAGRRTDGWVTSGTDANSEIGSARPRLVARARDLVRNNPWASKAVKSLTANVIGTGIIPRSDDQVDEVWARWADRADAAGQTDFYGLQALVLRTMVEAGEVLIRRRVRRPEDGLDVPMQLEVLEPDHLDTSKDVSAVTGGGWIEQGIEFDAIGRRRGYWLLRRHPGSGAAIRRNPFESRFVPADEIVHIFDPLRPGQIRGVTWFAAAIVKMRDLDDYDEAELVRKKIEACFAAFVTTDDENATLGAPEIETAVDGTSQRRVESFEPGMVEYLQPGRDVKFGEPKATGGYAEYMRFQLHAIAAAVDLTYELLTGDLSQVNFSSARVGLLEFRRRVKQVQMQILLPQMLLPVWGWFTDIGRANGALPAGEGRIGVKWSLPRFEAIEPLKDATAELVRIRSGTLTLAEAIAGHGFDPDDQLNEIEGLNSKLDKMGIVLDSDPRLVTKAGGLQGGQMPADDGEDQAASEDARMMAALLRRYGVPEHLIQQPNGHG